MILNIVVSYGPHIFIEFKNEGSSIRNPKTQYLCVVNLCQGLNHTSKNVLVSHEKYGAVFA